MSSQDADMASEKLVADVDLGEPSWEALRRLSLSPGGFGTRRVEIWPKLLHVGPSRPRVSGTSNAPGTDSHEDEDTAVPQAELSKIEPAPHQDERQIQLDTERSFVLYPVENAKDGRDVLQSQLHELLVAVFRKRPKLSYFQGYHDIVTVLFLTLPPPVQLCCAEKLSLHRVRDSMGASLEPVLGLLRILRNLLRLADQPYASLLERTSPLPFYALSNLLTLFSHDMPTLALIQHVFDWLLCRPPIAVVYLAAAILLSRKEEAERLEQEGEEGMVHSLLSGLPDLYDSAQTPSIKEEPVEKIEDQSMEGSRHHRLDDTVTNEANAELGADEKSVVTKIEEDIPDLQSAEIPVKQESDTLSLDPIPQAIEDEPADSSRPLEADDDPPIECSPPGSADNQGSLSYDPSSSSTLKEDCDEKYPPSPTSSSGFRSHRPYISLSSLLTKADDLYAQFPPTHPSLAVSSIMGPQSVVFTWSEDAARLPADDEAEAIVKVPELVVYPFIEDEGVDSEAEDELPRKKRKRRKLRKPRRFIVERRTMVTGAVLVLGVAMAAYGMRAHPVGDGHGHIGGREWRKIGRLLGGALLGASEKVLDGFGLW